MAVATLCEAKEEIALAVTRLWEAFGQAARGQTIAWADIEEVMGHGRYEESGRTIVRKFRRRLEAERRIVTRAPSGVGVRLLTHRQTIREAIREREIKARRQVNRGIRELETVDPAGLSVVERKLISVQRHDMQYQRLVIGRSYRAHAKSLEATPTNPIRRAKEAKE